MMGNGEIVVLVAIVACIGNGIAEITDPGASWLLRFLWGCAITINAVALLRLVLESTP